MTCRLVQCGTVKGRGQAAEVAVASSGVALGAGRGELVTKGTASSSAGSDETHEWSGSSRSPSTGALG